MSVSKLIYLRFQKLNTIRPALWLPKKKNTAGTLK